MKSKSLILITLLVTYFVISCKENESSNDKRILFLHHSTGEIIWNGENSSILYKIVNKISNKLAHFMSPNAMIPELFEDYNEKNNKRYFVHEMTFPKKSPYGWNNFPFDYYNIWVKNAGEQPFMDEPTLEILTNNYQVIIFKHCFPVSNIQAELDSGNINSDLKTISNYKLQYEALKSKLHEFPETKFILFTGAAQVKSNITEDKAVRAKEFFEWVITDWDVPGDNIYLWDLYSLQTEGGLYFKDDYAVSLNNSHPNTSFAQTVSKLLFQRVIDIVENNGNGTKLTGENF